MNKIFPKEFINTSIEHYTFRLRKRSISIYLIFVVAILTILISLPFIKTNVTVTTNGIISTSTNRFELSSPTSGLLLNCRLKENMMVKEGDTLLEFKNDILHKEQKQIDARLSELGNFLEDLKKLVRDNLNPSIELTSSRFQIALLKYLTELEKLNIEKEALKKVYERQKKLFNLKVISEVEFEKDQANHDRILA